MAVRHQHRPIVIDAVVLVVTAELRVEGLPHLADRNVQLTVEPATQLHDLLPIFLPRRFPFQLELAGAAAPTIMSESQKVESARSPAAVTFGITPGEATESEQLRLLLGD